MMSHVPNFMNSPLVVWVQTFSAEPLTYQDLVDGIFLNEVLQQIDPKSSLIGMNNRAEDVRDKLQNWEILLKNIRSYYQYVLECHIVMKPSDIFAISAHPESELARNEVVRTLHLLLGCAISCDEKETFIEGITHLNEDIQLSIMEYIQQIRDHTSNVFSTRIPTHDLNDISMALYNHLNTLLNQRDGYIQEIRALHQTLSEVDMDPSLLISVASVDNRLTVLLNKPSTGGDSTSSSSNKNHLVVEVAECKAKMRKLRQELEDRNDAVSELEEEVDSLKLTLQKLKNENLELIHDARSAKNYQDELDIYRERANRADQLESEIQRYREKLNDLDFYKARVEELRQDNSVLLDNRNVMEEQLESAHKRIEAVVKLESELQKYKDQRDSLAKECDKHRMQAQNLIEENARLEYERKVHLGHSSSLEEELQKAIELSNKDSSNSLYEQISQANDSQVLRLELENQRLKQDLEEMKENVMLENASKMLALEKENTRLANKVDRLLQTSGNDDQRCVEAEQKSAELAREKKVLEETIETVRENSERHVTELEKENDQLSQTIRSLRERSEKTNDLRVKDLETENRKLSDAVKRCTAQMAQLESEQRQANRKCKQLQDDVERAKTFEESNRRYEHTNKELKNAVEVLKSVCERHEDREKEYAAFDVTNQSLSKMVENLQKDLIKKEALEQENVALIVETQNLRRNLDSAEISKSNNDVLENEKEELEKQLRKAEESSRSNRLQLEKAEQEKLSLNAEKQQLQQTIDLAREKTKSLEREIDDQEGQIGQLVRKTEEHRQASKHLEKLEKRTNEMESEGDRLKKEKSNVDKENRKLKQMLKEKDFTVDELTSKATEIDCENKVLRQSVDRNKEIEVNLHELEKENLDLVQTSSVDKKTIGTLREDLVKEKIKCRQLQNELDSIQKQIDATKTNHEKLLVNEMIKEEGFYKSLECKMEEVYEKRVKSQEEQIRLLENRLDEYKNNNLKLQSEMETVRRSVDESIKRSPSKERTLVVTQRYSSHSQVATQDILNLKDQIIKLERNNAGLEEENRNVKRQISEFQDHVQHLQSQNSQWQSQVLSFQSQYNNLQAQLAKIQVENTTLTSENASLGSQNVSLQGNCSQTESALNRLQREHELLTANHESLERDLATIQRVHDQLTGENDALTSKHVALKENHKRSKTELKQLHDRCSELSLEQKTTAQLKKLLEQDKESVKSESLQHYESLHVDYIHVREDNLRLLNANDKLNSELQESQRELRLLKTEVARTNGRNADLTAEVSECMKQIGERNIEISKLVFRCEDSLQWISKLEDENRSLMMQLKLLITQNQDLLTQLLESKDQHVVEQKAYIERLADLRRQKEKLEEKIIDTYKRYDPVKTKNRSLTANLMKKAKQMIGGRSKERTNGDLSSFVDSGENSSQGSASHVPSSDSLATPDYSDVRHKSNIIDGESSASTGSDPRKSRQRQQLVDACQQTPFSRMKSANNNTTSSNQLTNTSTNTGISDGDGDDSSITLNEFLQECDQSPKSRRKLLVQKRVELDDCVDSVSDITHQPLKPRRPTIHAADAPPPSDPAPAMHASRSEANVSSSGRPRPFESNRRSQTQDVSGHQDASSLLNPTTARQPSVILRPKSQTLAPSKFFGAADAIADGRSGQRSNNGPHMPSDFLRTDSPRSYVTNTPQGGGYPSPGNRTNYVGSLPRHGRLQNQYNGYTNADYGTDVTANGRQIGASRDRTDPSRSSSYIENLRNSTADRDVFHDRRLSNDTQNRPNDLQFGRQNFLRAQSVPPEEQEQLRTDRRSNGLASTAVSPGDDGMVSQYNPINVRNLVQSYQQALKPGGVGSATVPSNSQPSTPSVEDNRSLQSMTSMALPDNSSFNDNSALNSSNSQNDVTYNFYGSAVSRNNSKGATVSDFGQDDFNPSQSKQETNVCIVRPATGPVLTQPPPPHHNLADRSDNGALDGSAMQRPTTRREPQSRSSAKSSKPSIYHDYGHV